MESSFDKKVELNKKKKKMFKKMYSHIDLRILPIVAFAMVMSNCSNEESKPDMNSMDSEPVAVNDTLTVEEDSSSGEANRINVSANDIIGENGGDGDDYSISTEPSNGTLTEISDGIFEYIPNYNYDGTDRFTYIITDADGDEATASVSITCLLYTSPSPRDA